MTEELLGANLKVIGIVRNGIRQRPESGWQGIVSELVIDSHLTEALDGLEEFSHIIVIYWMHQVSPLDKVATKVHPQGRQELPLVGFFATRAPYRVNPVGVTTVRLLERQGNILKVEGLDAVDGTPVIDIKPYIPEHGAISEAKVPSWVTKR
ncbi:tRNA (adenine(37)-N6)-methyltransferase [subsurface metagenome]